jgi:large subunit ribosomal protein L24
MKLNIKKGDTVKVIAGDDKGKSGVVLSVSPKELKAVVEGLNIVTRHLKPSAGNPQGSIVKKEAPLQVSNLQLVDKSGNSTRVGRKLNTSGKLQRYSKKTGEFID